MTDAKKPSSKKPSNKKTEETNQQNYTAVGVVFFVAGAAMLASEATRAVGIPFFILGVTFFALGQQDSTKRKK